MSTRLAFVAAAALAAVAAASVSPGSQATAIVEPAIGVVVTDAGGQIVAANADGSGMRALTHPNPLKSENDENPRPSPDGSRIAFTRSGIPSRRMVMRADGSGLRTLASGMLLMDAQWSPDGSRLALETSKLMLVAPDGSGSQQLVGGDAHPRPGFSWSPDSRSIAYTGEDSIGVIDVATVVRRVLVRKTSAWRPAWSPDGKRIAFLAHGNISDDVYVVSATGKDARRVATGAGPEPPVWSPDGTRLAYTVAGGRVRSQAVVVLDVVSGRVTVRIPSLGGGGSGAPAWSPDGSHLSFLRARTPRDFPDVDGDVWIADADGSRPRQVTSSFPFGGSHSTPHWLTGVKAVTPDPKPAAALLRPLAAQPLPTMYTVAAVDGKAAAIIEDSNESIDIAAHSLGVWRGSGQIVWIKGEAYADRVALAGDRIYWSWYGSDRSGSHTELWTSTWPHGRPVRLRVHTGDSEGPALMVAGDRSLVVYSYQGTLWRLKGARSTPIRKERSEFLEPLSVDNGRVLLWNGRALEVVTGQGKLLATLPPGAGPVAARLSGDRVVLLDESRIIVHRLGARKPVATWPVGAPGRASGAGVAWGALLPYCTENAYGAANCRLLDLASGRDKILALPPGTSPTSAAIGSSGLFYTAVPPYRGLNGQLGFVPRARLTLR